MLYCVGEILVDIFDDGDNQIILPGGAPFNVACNRPFLSESRF